MHIKQMTVFLASMAVAGSVLASAPVAGKTRVEVLRELEQARAAGQMSVPDAQYPRLAVDGGKGGRAAPSAALASCMQHQKIDPVYSGA
ncbi:MAG: DUF4148 domain-containing protein [Collimonas sp.]|uniref:DUF4148 domain-containing protein n=1 Tax=Collimonas sp. TaxID=1963772 RepID=UPI003264B943